MWKYPANFRFMSIAHNQDPGHLAKLNPMIFPWAHSSSLSRSLWVASHPSGMSAVSHSLVSTADLLRMYSIPLSMSLMETFNRTGPSTDPWGTPLVTHIHQDVESLITLHYSCILSYPSVGTQTLICCQLFLIAQLKGQKPKISPTKSETNSTSFLFSSSSSKKICHLLQLHCFVCSQFCEF